MSCSVMDKELADYILLKMQSDYDRIADDFSATRSFPWTEMKDLVEEYVQAGDRILDAGCGNGRLVQLMQRKKVFYEGIDGSPRLIEIARKKYGDHFAVKNLTDLSDYPDNSFSLVFCIATFQHIPGEEYRKQVLANFKKVLLAGGLLIMINWNILNQAKFVPYLKKSGKLLSGLDKGDILYPWRSQKSEIINRYYHGFSPEELEDLLGQVDFKLVEQYYTKRGEKASAKDGYNLVTIADRN